MQDLLMFLFCIDLKLINSTALNLEVNVSRGLFSTQYLEVLFEFPGYHGAKT